MTHVKTNVPTKRDNKACIQELFFREAQCGSSPDFSRDWPLNTMEALLTNIHSRKRTALLSYGRLHKTLVH